MYTLSDKDFKLSPHEEPPAIFANDSPLKELKGLQQIVQGATVMGALVNNNVWITNKVDIQFKDLSPRDWFDTKVPAIQIASTHALLLSLSEEG